MAIQILKEKLQSKISMMYTQVVWRVDKDDRINLRLKARGKSQTYRGPYGKGLSYKYFFRSIKFKPKNKVGETIYLIYRFPKYLLDDCIRSLKSELKCEKKRHYNLTTTKISSVGFAYEGKEPIFRRNLVIYNTRFL